MEGRCEAVSDRLTTLRELVGMCLKEKLKSDGMTRTEIKELTDYVLDNSSLRLTDTDIEIIEGNKFGVGEDNKDRIFTVPRFIAFKYSKTDAAKYFLNNECKKWYLYTFSSFDRLIDALTFNVNNKDTLILIDGEIIGYDVRPRDAFGYDVYFDKAIYSLTYVLEDRVQQEFFESNKELIDKIMVLVGQEAENIKVYDLITQEFKYFEVSKNIYTNREKEDIPKDFEELGIIWVLEKDEAFEEDKEWGDSF